jgi:phage terminase large subunit-like protein
MDSCVAFNSFLCLAIAYKFRVSLPFTQPQSAPWLGDFFAELLSFPNGKFDDQVDALAQAVNHAEECSRTYEFRSRS